MTFEYGYLGLFLASFLAATVLPVASEVFLLGMLRYGYDPMASILIATAGNTFGAWLNYAIGYLGNPKWLQRFGAKPKAIEKWQAHIHRFGSILALMSWLPIVGDIIGIALGFFKAPWFPTFIFMGLGKFARYLVVWAVYYWW